MVAPSGNTTIASRARASRRLERSIELWARAKRRLRERDVDQVDPELLRGRLRGAQLRLLAGVIGVRQGRQRAQARQGFLDQLHALACDLQRLKRAARQIAAGAREALDEPSRDRIAADREDDRDVEHRAAAHEARGRNWSRAGDQEWARPIPWIFKSAAPRV